VYEKEGSCWGGGGALSPKLGAEEHQ